MGPRQEAPCPESQSYHRPAFPPSGWVAAVNEKQMASAALQGPSEQPGAGARTAPGAASGDTDNLSPTQQRLRKDNGGTKLLQGGSGQHPSRLSLPSLSQMT